jgi:hypothetical protein
MNIFQQGLKIGGLILPFEYQHLGTLLMGAPGTGKTSVMKMMLSQYAAYGHSGIILNIGENYQQVVTAAYRHAQVVNFAAHTVGGVGIDFASIVTSAGARVRFCEKLAPLSEGSNNVFFDARVQMIVQAACHALHILAPGEWLLRDVLNLAYNSFLLETVTEMTRVPNPYLAFGRSAENRTRSDVQATVEAKLLPLRVYAALNAKCSRLVNPLDVLRDRGNWHIYEWSDRTAAVNESVIAFALDEVAIAAMEDAHRTDPLIISLDEVASLKPLNFLLAAGRRGRKSKLAIIAAIHERGSLSRYKDDAEEILALLRTKFFFQISSPQSAKWGSDYLGTPEVLESISPGIIRDNGGTLVKTASVKDRPIVHPDQLRMLPMASYENDRIVGFALLPNGTAVQVKIPFVNQTIRDIPGRRVTAVTEAYEELEPMTPGDLKRLNIPTDPRTLSLLDVHKQLKKKRVRKTRSTSADNATAKP